MATPPQDDSKNTLDNTLDRELDAFKINYPDQKLLEGYEKPVKKGESGFVKMLGGLIVFLTIVVIYLAIKISAMESTMKTQAFNINALS